MWREVVVVHVCLVWPQAPETSKAASSPEPGRFGASRRASSPLRAAAGMVRHCPSELLRRSPRRPLECGPARAGPPFAAGCEAT
jgi:hypothetical protein